VTLTYEGFVEILKSRPYILAASQGTLVSYHFNRRQVDLCWEGSGSQAGLSFDLNVDEDSEFTLLDSGKRLRIQEVGSGSGGFEDFSILEEGEWTTS